MSTLTEEVERAYQAHRQRVAAHPPDRSLLPIKECNS